MIGGKPENVKVTPPTSRTMLTNDDPPLFGVSTKCQYAPPPGHAAAGLAVLLCSGRLLGGNALADADCAWVTANHATVEPVKTRPKPIRLNPARSRRPHERRATWRARRTVTL
jgi:hypothetical protein